MFLLLARFHAPPVNCTNLQHEVCNEKSIILAKEGKIRTCGSRPYLKNVCALYCVLVLTVVGCPPRYFLIQHGKLSSIRVKNTLCQRGIN